MCLQVVALTEESVSFEVHPSIMADKFKNHPGLASEWTSVVDAIYKKCGKPVGSTPPCDDVPGNPEHGGDPESTLPGIDVSYITEHNCENRGRSQRHS